MKTLSIFLRVLVAIILGQTLYFKFTAAPESVYIFETVGMEPWGRIGIGILEAIAAVLILIRRTVVYGALLTFGIIGAAIFKHLTILGIEVPGHDGQMDGGLLFLLALITFICAGLTLFHHRADIPFVKARHREDEHVG